MTGTHPDPNWPNATASRFVEVPPHRWHLQVMGDGPDLLLLHGAGASTHSWAMQMPVLAAHWRVVALDLPGQGFTGLGDRKRCGMNPMAEDISALLEAEKIAPKAILAHSAGVALALWMAERVDGLTRIVGLNAALENFPGPAGIVFPAMARMLSALPFTAPLFSTLASGRGNTRRLLASTGSALPEGQLACYQALIERPEHVEATLAMMAQWEIEPLLAKLPEIACSVRFLNGSKDWTVRPSAAQTAARRMRDARFTSVANLGHVMHEEAPEVLNPLIEEALAA